jgi:outer membrane translocation and assembly module TamA
VSIARDARHWFNARERHVIDLNDAADALHKARRRLAHAKESYEETVAELYGENAVVGKNAEEREATLRRLTAAERYEIREAEDAVALAEHAHEWRERVLKQHDAEWRVIALEAQLLYPPLMTVPAQAFSSLEG